MDIQTLSRTSAIIYAEEMSIRKTNTIKRKFIETVFVSTENKSLTILEIANLMENDLNLSFSEEEIREIVEDDDFFIEELNRSSEHIKYSLKSERYLLLKAKETSEISHIIDKYIVECSDQLPVDSDTLRGLLNKYLYSLMNTNIAAYAQVIGQQAGLNSIRVDSKEFTEDEISEINKFLGWDNPQKNKALFQLVSCCVEYAIVVNNSKENIFLSALKNKEFYLDSNLIYRAIGINGETRKQRTTSFLKKCQSSGQKLLISKFTKYEFLSSIEYHLNLLNSSTPFGRISPFAFRRYANGEGFYQFYHEWRNGRISYGFEIFKAHIISLYDTLTKQYNIVEDYKVPFDEHDEIKAIEEYTAEIKAIKRSYSTQPHKIDAQNMYWLECIRGNNNTNIVDTKYYLITSDQKLQLWDSNNSKNQPLTLLPSQWLGLLLKYVSRSDDDYKSFVSFLSIPHNEAIIPPDELQVVMAGISEITEDFTRQETILESMVSMKFNGILAGKTQLNAKQFAKDSLEKEFEQRLTQKEQEKEQVQQLSDQTIAQIKLETDRVFNSFLNSTKMSKLQDIEKQIDSLEKRQNKAKEKINTKVSLLKTIIYGGELLIIILWTILIIKIGWDKMEMWTYIIGLPAFILPNLFFMIAGKRISLSGYISTKESSYKHAIYEDYDFSEEELIELYTMRSGLEKELNIQRP